MNKRIISALYKKEIRDIVRDKKTIFMMVVMPIFLYPLLVVIMLQVMQNVTTEMKQKSYRIAFENVDNQEEITKIMFDEEDPLDYNFQVVKINHAREQLENKEVDAYITEEEENGQKIYKIQYISTITDSSIAADMMKEVIEQYRENLRKTNIQNAGLDVKAILYPVTTQLSDHASGEDTLGNIIGSMVPFLLITSILLGSMYPAIDVTAGEKERGTLETVLTLPVSNYNLIMSKFFAVSTISCISALLNLVSMGFLGTYIYKTIDLAMSGMSIKLGEFLPAVGIMIICVMVFALFITALSLCVCLFAKSFKEAQNYITPLMLVVMLTGYIGFIPNIELTQATAAIPVANICLLIKQIFTFSFSYSNIMIVLVSNVAYSLLVIIILGKIYNSEAVLFGDGNGGIRILERRANIKSGQMPTIADAMVALAVVLLGMFYIGSYAQLKIGFWGVAVQQAIILLIPIALIVYLKYDKKKALSIRCPKVPSVFGSILLWIGSYILAVMVSKLLLPIFPSSLEYLDGMNHYFLEQNGLVLFLVVAVCPAVAEEVLFRGFVFSAMREKWKPWMAILVSSALFGLYHMDIIKFFTTGILGIAMAYSVYRSKSIFTSMIMHFCNNAGSVLCLLYPAVVGKIYQLLETEHVLSNIGLTVVGSLLVILGVCLLRGQREVKEEK